MPRRLLFAGRFFRGRGAFAATACSKHVCEQKCEAVGCPGPDVCRLDSALQGCLRCVAVEGEGPETVRLKRLGICEGQMVEVLQVGEPMIVRAAGTQVGLSRRLARQVTVRPVD